ncbi:MAG: nitroreductase family protein [Candidatus Omnitrophica bacterium]|nr:nitroreductase family protein [Candidatus Omnitrophota bacterium]MDD5311229.1 nitroreductase family protein [Candidatus Omnitrophota bacterium]MDD5545738.1 nitroreductase family protein [Candidatus Omnitrophota bacterium]
MDIFEAFKSRISVREYSDKPVEKEKLEKMVDAGRLAPTARGEQPWEFVIVTNKEKVKELADITDHGKFMSGASAAIVTFCKDTKYYLEDGCGATENILLAAAAQGIASCWIAGDKKDYGTEIAKALNVPADFKLISIISLGYPKEKPQPHQKRPLKEVMHWEKF